MIAYHGTSLCYLFERPLVDGTPEFEIRAATPEDGRVSWSSDGRSILAAVGEGDSDIVLLEGLPNVGRE